MMGSLAASVHLFPKHRSWFSLQDIRRIAEADASGILVPLSIAWFAFIIDSTLAMSSGMCLIGHCHFHVHFSQKWQHLDFCELRAISKLPV